MLDITWPDVPSLVGKATPPAVKFVVAKVVKLLEPLPEIFPVTLPVSGPIKLPAVTPPEKAAEVRPVNAASRLTVSCCPEAVVPIFVPPAISRI